MGSGFRTFASGEVLTAANVNNYLMEQAVMSFADSTARDAAVTSPEEGMIAYLQDVDTFTAYNGSSWAVAVNLNENGETWSSYTPTWTTTGTAPAIGNGSIVAQYVNINNVVIVQGQMTFGSTTTFGTGAWSLSTPNTMAAAYVSYGLLGHAKGYDSSGGSNYTLYVVIDAGSTTKVLLNREGTPPNVDYQNPFTWANGDNLAFNFSYRKAA